MMIMENRDNQNAGREDDLSKAQNQQQPLSGQTGQSEFGQAGQSQQSGEYHGQAQQPPSGQADYGSAGQSDTTTQQRRDIEGGTATGQASGSERSSFVGAQGSSDSSNALIEDEDSTDFSRDGQGASE
jgi:hypothetical protein